jgi:tetratricopeptide (TPR) repeat protein
VAPYRERYPDDVDVKLLEAFALLQFRQDPDRLEAARLSLEEVLDANPENGAAHFVLGLYYRDIPDLDEALRRFNLAIENGFEAADPYWQRANINRDRDVPREDVLEDYRRALELDPENDMILIDRGVFLLYYMIDPFSALQDFEASYAIDPATWKHELLGVAYLRLDRADEAFALYEQSAQGEMANEAYYLADGSYVALSAGHPELAREWAEHALALDPQADDARQVLGLVAAEEGDYEGALAHLDRVRVGQDGLPYLNWQFSHELKEDRARMLALLGETDEAITLYQEVVDEFGAWWSSPYLALGQLMLNQGDVESARGYFTQALETATNMHDDEDVAAAEDAFVDLQIVEAILEAESLLDQGDAEGAVEALDRVIDRFDPEWTDIYLLRGRALGELGDLEAAQDSLDRAREIAESAGETDMFPDIDEAQRDLDALQPPSGEGTVAEQISELETYIEDSETEDVQYYIELGMLYRDTGDSTAARQTLMRALAVTNDSGDEDGRAAVLDALRSLDSPPSEPPPTDDPEQRIVDLEQYIQDAQTTDIRWYLELATLYRDQGDIAEARRTLMRALAMLTTEGGDPDARNAVLDELRLSASTSEIPPPPTRGDDLPAYAEALDTYIKAHQLDNVDLYLELAGVYEELGDATKARRTLMRALAVVTTTGAEDQRPRLLDELRNLDEGSQAEPPSLSQQIEALEQRIDAEQPQDVGPYLELATLYHEDGDRTNARRTLMRALAMLTAADGDSDEREAVLEALGELR